LKLYLTTLGKARLNRDVQCWIIRRKTNRDRQSSVKWLCCCAANVALAKAASYSGNTI